MDLLQNPSTLNSSANPFTQADADLLRTEALANLLRRLSELGNSIGLVHRHALGELLLALSEQAMGLRVGRIAYALPCGAGKTQSVIALIAAVHALSMPLTFAVSATQILALGRIKRDLVAAGVPRENIGLRHSKSGAELRKLAMASEDDLSPYLEDTGNGDFPVMLVCHARIRGAKEFPSFCAYDGRKRNLLIWDESLITTDAEALSLPDAISSIERVRASLRKESPLLAILNEMRTSIEVEVERQDAGEKPTEFLILSDANVQEAKVIVENLPRHNSAVWRASLATVKSLLRLGELPVSIARTRQGDSGDGVICYKVAVDPQLDNIAILDASHTIRLLTHGPSIVDGTTASMRGCKRYAAVQVIEHRIASGKTTLLEKREKGHALAAHVADYLRAIPQDEPVLIFTHKGDDKKVLQSRMRADLIAHGIDVEASTFERKRINWLTWGNETSLNTMSDCTHVILCGITRRDPLELAASMAGQRGSLCYRMEQPEARNLMISEMAHCGLQAMSRGRCRRVDADGQALPMTLVIFGGIDGLAETLANSLPDVRWLIKKAHQEVSRTGLAAQQIAAYLRKVEDDVQEVSVTKLKRELQVALGTDAFRTAIDQALVYTVLDRLKGGSQWERRERSLVRAER